METATAPKKILCKKQGSSYGNIEGVNRGLINLNVHKRRKLTNERSMNLRPDSNVASAKATESLRLRLAGLYIIGKGIGILLL